MNATSNVTVFRPVVHGPAFIGWFTWTLLETILGAVGFIVLFVVILSNKKIRSGCGVLIAHSLVIQFILGTVFFLTFSVGTYVAQTGWGPNPREFCHGMMFLCFTCFFANSMSSVIMSTNRLFALLFPHHYKYLVRKPVLVFFVLLPWLFGFSLNLPVYLGVGADYEAVPPFYNCAATPHKKDYTYLAISTLGFQVPMVLSFLIYLLVFAKIACMAVQRKLKRVEAVGPSSDRTTGKLTKMPKRRLNIAKILFVAAAWDCVCIMPIPIIVQWYPQLYFASPYTQLWLRTLVYSASMPTPIFFFAMNREYRDALRSLGRRIGADLSTHKTSNTGEPN